jgi:hypothetical protein
MKGNITILVDGNGARIEVEDESSGIQFLKINLSAEQFTACLGQLANVECDMNIRGLDLIGKMRETGKHEFKIPAELYNRRYKEREYFYKTAQELAQSQLADGWIADSYFGSQGSFFQKDGEQWARVTIRRWV